MLVEGDIFIIYLDSFSPVLHETFTLVDVQISITSHHIVHNQLRREWVSYTRSTNKCLLRVAKCWVEINVVINIVTLNWGMNVHTYMCVCYFGMFQRKQKFEQIVQFRVIKCGSTLLTLFMRKFFSFRVFYLQ